MPERQNGTPVTWRELDLVLERLDENFKRLGSSLDSLGDKVDALNLQQAAYKGQKVEKSRRSDLSWKWVTVLATLVCGLVTEVAFRIVG